MMHKKIVLKTRLPKLKPPVAPASLAKVLVLKFLNKFKAFANFKLFERNISYF